jgi:hypothetical protein
MENHINPEIKGVKRKHIVLFTHKLEHTRYFVGLLMANTITYTKNVTKLAETTIISQRLDANG